MVRTYAFVAAILVAFLTFGAAGAWLYQEYTAYRQMQALLPQIVNVLNAHEVTLQKITGAPTVASPASGAGSGATPPAK